MREKVIIIGAGLSGLSAAWALKNRGISAKILEANSRTGGRIWSIKGSQSGGPFELGATWLGEKHRHLNQLMQALGIERFEQYSKGKAFYEVMSFLPPQQFEVPYQSTPYYRIKGGSAALINGLVAAIGPENIQLNCQIRSVELIEEGLCLKDEQGQKYFAEQVILTLPPCLAEDQLVFKPNLPEAQRQAMRQTPTWMSHSIKFLVEYERPFWREEGKAGMAISQTGIISEVHDHSSFDEKAFSLMGFLSAKASLLTAREREEAVLQHLVHLFGESAANYTSYIERVWAKEPFTSTANVEWLNAHPHYGAAILRQTHLDGRLIFSGSETSALFGGYMEGAVYAGKEAAASIV